MILPLPSLFGISIADRRHKRERAELQQSALCRRRGGYADTLSGLRIAEERATPTCPLGELIARPTMAERQPALAVP